MTETQEYHLGTSTSVLSTVSLLLFDIEMANENKIKVTKSDGQEVLMKVTS